jgi:hypothetical protein
LGLQEQAKQVVSISFFFLSFLAWPDISIDWPCEEEFE